MRERSEWNYSPMRNRLFEVCSYLTIATLTLDICALLLGIALPDQTFSLQHPQWFIWVGFGALFPVIAVCVLSQWFLWIGMMVWTAFWSREWIVSRVLLVLAQLVTLSFGSALVYAIFYRRHHNRIQSRALLRAGVTG
ncbi:MAG: hypothetical protein WA294_22695 [Acidobacteriaceae bacterium]